MHSQLLEWVDYHPETGVMLWKKSPGLGRNPGDRVGIIQRNRFRSAGTAYRTVRASRAGIPYRVPISHLIYFFMTCQWPKEEMDHINGDSLDDRWCNLRPCTRTQNEANKGAHRDSKTGVKGVFPAGDGKRYRVQFHRRGQHVHVGTFDTLEQAKDAYVQAVKDYDVEFLRVA